MQEIQFFIFLHKICQIGIMYKFRWCSALKGTLSQISDKKFLQDNDRLRCYLELNYTRLETNLTELRYISWNSILVLTVYLIHTAAFVMASKASCETREISGALFIIVLNLDWGRKTNWWLSSSGAFEGPMSSMLSVFGLGKLLSLIVSIFLFAV